MISLNAIKCGRLPRCLKEIQQPLIPKVNDQKRMSNLNQCHLMAIGSTILRALWCARLTKDWQVQNGKGGFINVEQASKKPQRVLFIEERILCLINIGSAWEEGSWRANMGTHLFPVVKLASVRRWSVVGCCVKHAVLTCDWPCLLGAPSQAEWASLTSSCMMGVVTHANVIGYLKKFPPYLTVCAGIMIYSWGPYNTLFRYPSTNLVDQSSWHKRDSDKAFGLANNTSCLRKGTASSISLGWTFKSLILEPRSLSVAPCDYAFYSILIR